ncbi:MAG: biotin/lipoyl-containing protein [Acidimicrobiales bacterium]
MAVAPGDAVAVGDAICTMEAMKMENTIAATVAGTVTEVKVEAGQTVGAGDVIAIIG